MKRLVPFFLFLFGVLGFVFGTLYHVKQGSLPDVRISLSDLYQYYFPLLTFAKRSIVAGSFPLWNPYQAIGAPFFAATPCGLLYPVNWTIFFMDLASAFLVIQIAAVGIGMLGAFVFARHLKLEWPAVLLTTILFGYSVMNASAPSNGTFNLAMGSSYCWLPTIFWLTCRLFQKPNLRNSVGLSGVLALSFLGGHQQFFYYNCLLVSVFLLTLMFFTRSDRRFRANVRIACLYGLAFLLMTGLAAAQLAPTLELSLQSARNVTQNLYSGGDPFSQRFDPIGAVWSYIQRDNHATYLGATVLLLPFAFGAKRRRAVVISLVAAFIFSMLFVLSNKIPSLFFLRKILLADMFRVHVRIMESAWFLIIMLAGIGLSSLWQQTPLMLWDRRARTFRWFWLFVIVSAVFFLFPLLCLLSRLIRNSPAYMVILLLEVCVVLIFLLISSSLPKRTRNAGILAAIVVTSLGLFLNYDVLRPVQHAGILLAAVLAFFLVLARADEYSPGLKVAALWVVAGLLLADIISYRHVRWTNPAEVRTHFDDFEQEIEWIKADAGYHRVALTLNGRTISNVASMVSFFNLNSAEPFTLKRWENFVRETVGAEVFQKIYPPDGRVKFLGEIEFFEGEFLSNARMAGLASLRYYIRDHPAGNRLRNDLEDGWVLCHGGDEESDFSVYENIFCLPRVYVVGNYLVAHNERESLRAIEQNSSRLNNLVVLENGVPSFAPVVSDKNPGEAAIEKYEINRVEVTVEAGEDAILVLTDSYYPGWVALVDGEPKPIWRANSLFRAVEIPPGAHEVAFEYRPASVRRGAVVSLGSLVVVVALLFLQSLRQKQNASRMENQSK